MRLGHLAAYSAVIAVVAGAANAQGVRDGKTVFDNGREQGAVDYRNAKPMPLPRNTMAPKSQADLLAEAEAARFAGFPGAEPGGEGDGKKSLVQLPLNKALDEADDVVPQEYGTKNHPYTTAVAEFPTANFHRRSGKLFLKDGSASYVCSASLIKRGVVVTAAHCVAPFGERRFYQSIKFVPAYWKGAASYGIWKSAQTRVMSPYYDGSDSCYGVVCANDVAVIVLKAKKGAYPGANTGWYGYGWDGYGFVGGAAAITQLGYPTALNGGGELIRTDSQGFVSAALLNSTVIGSLQTGGSSGGPWLVNFGLAPTLGGGLGYGMSPEHNIVVGATSWGYIDKTAKQQGASPFTSGNIVALVNAVCADFPTACR